jgi:hypothetical protein
MLHRHERKILYVRRKSEMTPDLIWKNFSSAMADIILSQRTTRSFSDTQLKSLNEQEVLRKSYKRDESTTQSIHNMSFIDPRNGNRIFYDSRRLTAVERMTQVVLKKNMEYQFLIMEAYEIFEDAIESIYAFLGKKDINFWPLAEFGSKKYNEINDLSFEFYAARAEKRKGGAILIAKTLIDYFECDCDVNMVSLKQSIIFIEKIRHVTVHRRGIVIDKKSFFEIVAKDCGKYNNGNIDSEFLEYMNVFFGSGEYENMINIIEQRLDGNYPIIIELSRFEKLLSSLLLCVYILCHESNKYIESFDKCK